MKRIALFIGSLVFLSCSSTVDNTASVSQSADTIKSVHPTNEVSVAIALDSLIVSHELADCPFDKVQDINYFKKHFKEVTKTEQELQVNQYDESTTDTIKKMFWGKSYIETTSNISSKRLFLNYAVVNDNNIVLRNNIRIGQTIKEVFAELKINYNPQKTYKYLELETTKDAAGYLTFYFENNKLNSIIYSPYTG